jgi:hypothetical protein
MLIKMKSILKSSYLSLTCLRVFAIILFIQMVYTTASYAQLYIDGTSVVVRKNALLFVDGDLETTKSGSIDPLIGNWGTIEITGNTDLNSSTRYNGNGELHLTGTSTQTLSSSSIPLKKLKIENDANVELDDDFILNGDLTLTDGFLILGDNNLNIGDSVDISGGSSSSYIRVNGTGKVITNVGSDPVTLPIGRNPYLPIVIDDGGGREFTVGITEGVYDDPENETTLQTSNVVGETWTIESSASQNNVVVTLQWNASEEETGFARNAASLSYWEDGVSSNWNVGSPTAANGSGPYTLSRTVNFTSNLYYFGVGSAGSALPVEFTYFTATWQKEGEIAVLNWQTALEENNSHFEIQRSLSGVEGSWEQIGRVEGQGTTFDISEYQFVDDGLESKVLSLMSSGLWTSDLGHETVYYRLKQVDYNGQFDYSEIRTLNFKLETRNSFDLWPNPNNGQFLNLSKVGNYQIINSQGVVLITEAQTNRINIEKLPAGTYLVRNDMGNLQKLIVR